MNEIIINQRDKKFKIKKNDNDFPKKSDIKYPNKQNDHV